MKRVIAHWTAGTYAVSGLDKEHYHYIVDGSGNIVDGKYPVSANASPINGKYAAHTLNCNSDSIGIACACMLGAEEGKTNGKFPINEVQFEAMCKDIAKLCRIYGIPIKPETVLSHAEVQGTLGIKQRGKWDIAVLPFKGLTGAKACGDYMRTRVQSYVTALATPKLPEPAPKPVVPKYVDAPAPAPAPTPVPVPAPKQNVFLSFLAKLGIKR